MNIDPKPIINAIPESLYETANPNDWSTFEVESISRIYASWDAVRVLMKDLRDGNNHISDAAYVTHKEHWKPLVVKGGTMLADYILDTPGRITISWYEAETGFQVEAFGVQIMASSNLISGDIDLFVKKVEKGYL